MGFFIVSYLFSFLLSNLFSYPVILLGFWFSYLSFFNSFFNSSYYLDICLDSVSLFIVFITVFVMFISYVYSIYTNAFSNLFLVFLSILFFCFEVFSTSNLFYLYLFYECSLLPILYVILKWGSYPERSLSALMLLVYTSVFTFPFIVVIFNFFVLNGSFLLSDYSLLNFVSIDSLSSVVIFCTFAVNLPVYGLHFWLPMAHVEAPTFGSIILAGVLLKLGGVGLLRCVPLVDLNVLYSVFISYFIISMLYVTVVCMFQSDLNRLIAYSSVSHIMSIPFLFMANNLLSVNSATMLMLFHGLSSPVLFILVGLLYSLFSSRQLIVIRGLILTSPLLSFILILSFFFTLSAPPFPSFISEVNFFISTFFLSSYLMYVFIIFAFFSLVYNLNWLSSIIFSSSTPSNMSVSFTFLSFIPLLISFIFCVPLMLLTHLF